jgi:Fe-Mn family superoxide dismutase
MTQDSQEMNKQINVQASEITSEVGRRQFLKMAAMAGGSLLAAQPLLSTFANDKTTPCKTHKGCTNGNCSKKGCNDPKCGHTQPTPAAGTPLMSAIGTSALIQAKDFEARFASIEGISANQLKQHVGLYQNYVKKVNEIVTALNAPDLDLSKVNATYDPYRELHVEQSFALNGVVLHEQYFENMGGNRTAPSEALKDAIAKRYGSWNEMMVKLKALSKSMRGWAMLGFNMRDGQIHLYGLDSHNQLAPFNVSPLLVVDVFEHAYMIDFGTNRGSYLDAFMANIDWAPVEKRLIMAQANFTSSL